MIRLFIRQHIAWLLFIGAIQLFINVLFYLDSGIQGVSLRYFNVVWLALSLSFLGWRFLREAKQMKKYETLTGNYMTTVQLGFDEQLRQLHIELQEKNLMVLERQDELLAWVHEMKSPMTALQLLIDKVDVPELKERIENEWLRLYLLLDQQLHATRLMTIEQDNRLEKVRIKDVVIQEVRALRSWCFERNIALELEALEVDVVTDAKWLGFIVRQILSNAVKYSNQGGQVHIFTDGNTLLIRDEGIGIAREDLPRVFRKSYTGTVGRETSAATGMGLYLAKQAADSLDIVLKIESGLGKGTTVSIHFPQQNDYDKTLGM